MKTRVADACRSERKASARFFGHAHSSMGGLRNTGTPREPASNADALAVAIGAKHRERVLSTYELHRAKTERAHFKAVPLTPQENLVKIPRKFWMVSG